MVSRNIKNGLRQGCTMVPTLFNLYACVEIEEWLEKVKNVQGAGTHILYRLDKQLFRKSTKGACTNVWSVLGSVNLQMMLLCWQLHVKLRKHCQNQVLGDWL